jgi:hypothetical protein
MLCAAGFAFLNWNNDPMHSADAQRLAETMSALAVNLAAEHDQQATLKAIVAAAVTTVPGATWAGISLIAGRDITAATSTADIVTDIDQMQRDLDEGPCVTAIREHHTVLSNDLASDSRWPRFAIKAAERGVQSMLSFRLFVAAADLGALISTVLRLACSPRTPRSLGHCSLNTPRSRWPVRRATINSATRSPLATSSVRPRGS